MEKLGLNEIRERFLAFFESKGHLRQKSFPLVPQGDASLLLINSGMAPMKPYFSGEAVPPRVRMTTCQKCIRTPDIERVGRTSRHGTFFEMLGNFSFGDYFKKEAIEWAWEFLTETLELPADKLHITVYQDDDEAWDLWEHHMKIDPSHISRMGKEDNFWEIGSGPCGPCSEIYVDRGPEKGCGSPDCKVGCECDRYVEIWNLVFTQFNNDGEGNYTELKHKNIDTGMGLERLACIMQDVESLFDVDTVMNITKHVSQITGASYGQTDETDVSLRVITDHIRSTTMMVCDGVLPSNEGRGYVLRRLLRRASRHGKLLGVNEPFLYKVCETVIDESRMAYPELEEKRGYIIKVIKNEEENFNKTIDSGMQILGDILKHMEAKGESMMTGADSFKLYDTYGFPVDLTLEILEEKGLKLDRKGFDKLMTEQRERARSATAALGDFAWASLDLGLPKDEHTEFTGYEKFEDRGKVLVLVVGEELRSSVAEGEEAVLVLDRTPFYSESGGQISDIGAITAPGFVFKVENVKTSGDGKYMHMGRVETGSITVDSPVTASIDEERRKAIMRAHSCTHLLHRVLKNVLGDHVEQAGSLVTTDTIRFDFTHFSAITNKELQKIDEEINNAILDGLPITVTETGQEEAKKMGATALFGEKYGDVVRVVKMGDFSIELCGGTHLDNTAKIGSYRSLSEFSVASGVRRIEANVGKAVLAHHSARHLTITRLADLLKTNSNEVVSKVELFLNEAKENRRTIDKLVGQQITAQANEHLVAAKEVEGLKVVALSFPDAKVENLRKMGDIFRDKAPFAVTVVATVQDDKITFVSACGKEAVARGVKAGELIKHVTSMTGGSGGGKPDSAMGGGKDVSKLEEALASVEGFVREKLAK